MEGQYFAPIVKVVIFDDFFVFLGAKTWYRFEGMTSFNQSLRQGNSDYRFPRPPACAKPSGDFSRETKAAFPA